MTHITVDEPSYNSTGNTWAIVERDNDSSLNFKIKILITYSSIISAWSSFLQACWPANQAKLCTWVMYKMVICLPYSMHRLQSCWLQCPSDLSRHQVSNRLTHSTYETRSYIHYTVSCLKGCKRLSEEDTPIERTHSRQQVPWMYLMLPIT